MKSDLEDAIYEEILTKKVGLLIDIEDNSTLTKTQQNVISFTNEQQQSSNTWPVTPCKNDVFDVTTSTQYSGKPKLLDLSSNQIVNKTDKAKMQLHNGNYTEDEMNLYYNSSRSQSVDDLKDLMMASTSMFIARETQREIAIMNERNMRSKSKSMREISAAKPRPLETRKSMPSSTFQKTIDKIHLTKSKSDNSQLYVISDSTEYSEILSDVPVSEITTGRPTRESENPILRVHVLPSPCGSVGSDSSNHSSLNDINNRSSINHSDRHGSSSSSVYENIDSPTRIHSDVYENMNGKANSLKKERRFQSFYENSHDDSIDAISRNRCLSQGSKGSEIPINGHLKNNVELLYSDIDFGNDDVISLSSQSSRESNSLSSSGCTSSSLSSSAGQSIFGTYGGISNIPPPLPRPRNGISTLIKRPTIQGWTNCNVLGLSYFKALYLGSFAISKPSYENVDIVIKDAVHKTHMTDTISIFVDVNNDIIKFGTSYSPWELVTHFNVDDIHCIESYSKDIRILGIVTSQPGHDARCYVLQSDEATLIADAIKDVFKSQPKVFSRWSSNDRPQTICNDLSSNEQSFCFQKIIQIGRVRVKQSYLVINESIHAMLKNVQPKDYRAVNFGVIAQSVVISNPITGIDEETQSIPWILSLGVYEKDCRYFGYIVTDNKIHGKMNFLCYVYRCPRVVTAADIIEHLRMACQNTYQYNNQHNDDKINNDEGQLQQLQQKTRKISSPKRTDFQPITKRLSKILMVTKDHKGHEELSSSGASDTTDDVKTTHRPHRLPSAVIKNPFKKSSSERLSTEKTENSMEKVEIFHPEVVNISFNTFYLCSTVINPPLKPKYVRECYKQFCKQMQKQRKHTNGNPPGSLLNLNLNSITGITMADPKNPNGLKREFPIETIEKYSEHPDNTNCFAFSTSVSDDDKHKCHVFCFDNTVQDKIKIEELRRIFDELLKRKSII